MKRNRVLTRDELLAELGARDEQRSTGRLGLLDRESVSALLADLAELGADPVGQAKQLIDEEIPE